MKIIKEEFIVKEGKKYLIDEVDLENGKKNLKNEIGEKVKFEWKGKIMKGKVIGNRGIDLAVVELN